MCLIVYVSLIYFIVYLLTIYSVWNTFYIYNNKWCAFGYYVVINALYIWPGAGTRNEFIIYYHQENNRKMGQWVFCDNLSMQYGMELIFTLQR